MSTNAPTPSPQEAVMQMINGKCISRCVSLVADLAIPDQLKDGPRDVASLAKTTGADADSLYRVLRMLAGLGMFEELPDRKFQNTPLSESLRSDVEGSLRHYARWYGDELHWHVWSGLDHSVRTGKPSINRHHPAKSPFEILADHPSSQAIFNEAMTGFSLMGGGAIVEAYDFSRYARIIDVGGGHGALASLIAQSAPQATVTLFDQPHIVDGVREHASEKGFQVVAGSFLEPVSGPADLCVLKHIIHDWDDGMARRILANTRAALADNGRVLVCEMVLTPGPESTLTRILDIEMLVGPGGRERTEAEYAELFASAGLHLDRVIGTQSPVSLLEASSAS